MIPSSVCLFRIIGSSDALLAPQDIIALSSTLGEAARDANAKQANNPSTRCRQELVVQKYSFGEAPKNVYDFLIF